MRRRNVIALACSTAICWGWSVAAQDAETAPAALTLEVVQAFDLGGLETRTAALMLSAQEAGELDMALTAIPLPHDSAEPEVSSVLLAIDISGDALLAADEAARAKAAEAKAAGARVAGARVAGARVAGARSGGASANPSSGDERPLITEVYAYAIGADSGLAASLTQAFQLDAGLHRGALTGGSVQFFGAVELPPGEYSLRVLVSHRRSSRIGLRIQQVVVPSWRAERVLLPPLRREPAGPGLIVRQAGAEALPFPIEIDGRQWVPTAPRSVSAETRAAFLLLGRGLEGELRAELVGSDGEVLPGAEVDGPRPVADGLRGVETLAAELLPVRLDAGDYRLRISSSDGLAAVAPFSVRLPVSSQTSAAGDALPRPARSKGNEALRAAFLQAFEFLKTGDRAALQPLIALEQTRMGSGRPRQQKQLADAELTLAAELGSYNVEALVPLMWLHEELYRYYRDTQRLLLATHSREVLIRLTQLYSDNQTSDEAGSVVADVLVSLAGFLQNAGSLMSAENAYDAALDHRADHTAALIGLATIRESYGAYEGAVEALEQLVKTGAADPEISLRLALNLVRTGSPKRATERLQRLAGLSAPSWVAALASQELARQQVTDQQPEAAITTLEAAVERHPQVQRLRLQLASLLDQQGSTGEAREVLKELDPQAGRDRVSPRMRYSQMPKAPYLTARQAIAEAAAERLDLVIEPLTPVSPEAPAGELAAEP
ncbi:MAG: tetratricopeptide repeat protein [Acidobacteriota bacterium]